MCRGFSIRRARPLRPAKRARFATARAALERVFPHEVPHTVLKAVFGSSTASRLPPIAKDDSSIECSVVAR
jgi:hypothetical protein